MIELKSGSYSIKLLGYLSPNLDLSIFKNSGAQEGFTACDTLVFGKLILGGCV